MKRFLLYFLGVTTTAVLCCGGLFLFANAACRMGSTPAHHCVGSEWMSAGWAIAILAATALTVLLAITVALMWGGR